MSRQAVETILENVLVDESFRARLFTDPRSVCAPFDLTESEFLDLMGEILPKPQSSRLCQPHRLARPGL